MWYNGFQMEVKLKRYTIFAQFKDGGVEEIDVDAKNKIEATTEAKEILTKQYFPGWRIIRVEERFGLYF